mgnify:CR=1 FL=1
MATHSDVASPPSTAAGVEVRNLYKVFGSDPQSVIRRLKAGASKETALKEMKHVVAVNDISFSVLPGEIFVVMGLSGSGKSTLIRCINRLIEPSAGQILIEGDDIATASDTALRQARLHKIAMVFQHFALFPHRTVGENVEYGLKIRGLAASIRRVKAMEMLELVGLANVADRFPRELSGGMQQRVGLARALAVEPKVLLMDEPFSALDPITRGELQDELMMVRKRLNTAIVFITHDIDEALKLGDRIAVMRDGSFVQVGKGADIALRPQGDYVSAFTRDVDLTRLLDAGSIMRSITISSRADIRTATAKDGDDEYLLDGDDHPIGFRPSIDRGEAAHRTFPAVHEAAKLNSFVSACKNGHPVAVIDQSGRLRGVITPADILAALASGSSRDNSVVQLGCPDAATIVPLVSVAQAKRG